MSQKSRRQLGTLVLLCFVAFGLRLHRLDAVPLRGDEAFAVQYWADDPAAVVDDLAHWEPHPFGTFFGFWAWKNAAGDSAFAMRYLPLLGNLLGAVGMVALGKRVFGSKTIGLIAAALWAINPFLIWHAQDVRNYALWAAISPLAMWLFLRAVETNRPRTWALYIALEAIALYTFFLEAFFVVVQGIYLLTFHRYQPAIRRATIAWGVLAVLLIPWFIQAGWLINSDYAGTLGDTDLPQLLTWFLPTMLIGQEPVSPWHVILPLGWCILVTVHIAAQNRAQRQRSLCLISWALVPTLLLIGATTRMAIFHPRYLIAAVPAVLLLTAAMLRPLITRRPALRHVPVWLGAVMLLVPIGSMITLADYYRSDDPKSPNWPGLADFLASRAGPDDLILRPAADPAFNYYYAGRAAETSLKPDEAVSDQLDALITQYNTIWLAGRETDAAVFLNAHMQQVSAYPVAGFDVSQFRAWTIAPGEIDSPANVTIGDIVRLAGFTLQGPDSTSEAITVMLYWVPLAQSENELKVFVHLIGPPHPATGSPVWSQDDHPPRYGFPGTTGWTPGEQLRDPYNLVPENGLPPGDYHLEAGLYDPASGERLPVLDADGSILGDSVILASFHWP
ncbi:MAG: glycosyltransferase family 39 protein [Anaerolineae bacterium]|nr:glycosyltransferase family 39 protein [Anaerolineae bacterium]